MFQASALESPAVRASISCFTAATRRCAPVQRFVPLCIALALVPSITPVLYAQSTDDPRFAEARAVIAEAMREADLPSVAVAVARNGEVVWAEGFGWADLERRIPATPRTMYSLASISKPITATALMRLVEQKRIDLDRPANEYLAEGRIHSRAWNADSATVRRVLSHSAGLPLHYEFFYDGEEHAPRSTDEGVARYGVLVSRPGTVYQYSNLGYGIIDRILEVAHGRPYADVLRSEVFEPLGMTRSTVSTGAGLDDSVAVRYGPENEPVPYYDFDHRGGSAVYSSALDLVRFGSFHIGVLPDVRSHVLADSTRALMQRPVSAGATSDGYGLGWGIVSDDGGYRRVAHTGGMPGVSTVLNLYPEEGVVVAVLTNRSNGWTWRIAQALAGAVLQGYADSVQARHAADERAADEPPPDLASLHGEWTGMIHTPDDSVALRLVVQPDGDVHVRLGEELTTLLNDVAAPEGTRLIGRFAGTLPDRNAKRHAHSVLLDVRLRGDRLVGQATAQTTGWPYYFALTSFVQLERAQP